MAVPMRHGMESSQFARYIVGVAFSILGTACSGGSVVKPSDDPLNNPMFSGAALISIGGPGSGCRVSSQPVFTWAATGKRLVYAGVFSENVTVSEGTIVNTNTNVWAWHSGLGTARE